MNFRHERSAIQALRGAAVALMITGIPAHLLYAQQCPTVDSSQGYPLTISWAAGSGPDRAWLDAFGRSAAFRWQVPTRRDRELRAWRRVHTRIIPPEPRWGDDWSPSALHRAEVAVTVYADGRLRAGEPSPGSGDPFFDHSLPSIAADPMPGAPRMPAWPYGMTSDTVLLLLSFGLEDVAGPHAVVRFAAQQSPPQLIPATWHVRVPRAPAGSADSVRHVTVKYDVTDSGSVAVGSIEVLEATDAALGRAVRTALAAARFEPARSNCRPILLSVLQTFEF